MRTQGQDRFIGQATEVSWKARSIGAAAMVREAITQEMADDIAIRSQNKPKYNLTVTLVVGSAILVLMLAGVWIGVAHVL